MQRSSQVGRPGWPVLASDIEHILLLQAELTTLHTLIFSCLAVLTSVIAWPAHGGRRCSWLKVRGSAERTRLLLLLEYLALHPCVTVPSETVVRYTSWLPYPFHRISGLFARHFFPRPTRSFELRAQISILVRRASVRIDPRAIDRQGVGVWTSSEGNKS